MESKELVSVIMSVYNEEKYISAAIESILNQTYKNIELIIIDDCSSDKTVQIINSYKDNRILLVQNKENLGLTRNLNKGLELANGTFIARMDGDDICELDRVEKQLSYMKKNPEVMLISCQTKQLGGRGLVSKRIEHYKRLKVELLLRPLLAHPGFFMSRKIIEDGFLYDETFKTAQDYDFQVRVSKVYKVAIVNEPLLLYRIHDGQVSAYRSKSQNMNADRVRINQLRELGIEINDEVAEVWNKWGREEKDITKKDINLIEDIIREICTKNEIVQRYEVKSLRHELYILLFQWIIRTRSLTSIVSVFFSDINVLKKGYDFASCVIRMKRK